MIVSSLNEEDQLFAAQDRVENPLQRKEHPDSDLTRTGLGLKWEIIRG
jgi:hypothetical protein